MPITATCVATPPRVHLSGVMPGLADSFARGTGPWGTPDVGPAWVATHPADTTTSNGRGLITLTSTGVQRWVVSPLNVTDVSLSALVSTDKAPVGAAVFAALVARATTDGQNGYVARVEFRADGTVYLGLRKRVAGTETALSVAVDTGWTHAANRVFGIRLRVVGDQLRARVWPTSVPEPASWDVEWSDTDLAGPGGVGVRANAAAGVTNLPVTVAWDDIRTRGQSVIDRQDPGGEWHLIREGDGTAGVVYAVDDGRYPPDVPLTYRLRVLDEDDNTVVLWEETATVTCARAGDFFVTPHAIGRGVYQVRVSYRGGRVPLVTLREPLEVRWNRKADDTSDALVRFAVPRLTSACVQQLGEVEPWAHELGIYRDGALVWEGPIVSTLHGTSTIEFTARDVSAWLDRRVNHVDWSIPDGTTPAEDVARALIVDAFSVDDPNVTQYLDVRPSGILAGVTGKQKTLSIGEELRELAKIGLDWTVIGRRIVLFGPVTVIGRVRGLSDEDFAGDALTVQADGTRTASRACVISQDQDRDASSGQYTAGGVPVEYARACYEDPTFEQWSGVHEAIIKDDSQIPPSVLAATNAARAYVAAGSPTPLFIGIASGAELAACAPVTVDELIPGVLVPVTSGRTTRRVSQTMQLVSVQGTYTTSQSGDPAESISVNLTDYRPTATSGV